MRENSLKFGGHLGDVSGTPILDDQKESVYGL